MPGWTQYPKCRTLHLPLLNFMTFPSSHFSRLQQPCSPPWDSSFGIMCKLPESALYPIIQIVNKDMTCYWTQQRWLLRDATGNQVPAWLVPPTTISWAQHSSWFSTHLSTYSVLIILAPRILWETVSKALLKLRYVASIALPSSTQPAISL